MFADTRKANSACEGEKSCTNAPHIQAQKILNPTHYLARASAPSATLSDGGPAINREQTCRITLSQEICGWSLRQSYSGGRSSSLQRPARFPVIKNGGYSALAAHPMRINTPGFSAHQFCWRQSVSRCICIGHASRPPRIASNEGRGIGATAGRSGFRRVLQSVSAALGAEQANASDGQRFDRQGLDRTGTFGAGCGGVTCKRLAASSVLLQ
jgi:hypothetical protein